MLILLRLLCGAIAFFNDFYIMQFLCKHSFKPCHLSAIQVTLHLRNYRLNDVLFHNSDNFFLYII